MRKVENSSNKHIERKRRKYSNDIKIKRNTSRNRRKRRLLAKKGVQQADIKNESGFNGLQDLQNKIKVNKTVGISEWSFIKQGKPELFTAVYPDETEIGEGARRAYDTPTLASLSSRIGLAGQFL